MLLKHVQRAAALCAAAYQDNPTQIIANLHCKQFTHGTDDVLLCSDSLDVWVVFKGTEATLREWLHNFRFLKVDIDELGDVNQGFFANLQGLWSQLNQHPEFSRGRVFFVGHSRGGAIAQLAAAVHAIIYGSRPRVITFGSPKAGGTRWAGIYAHLDIRTLRLTHGMDIVTKVPLFTHSHAGEQKIIGRWRHRMKHYLASVENLKGVFA